MSNPSYPRVKVDVSFSGNDEIADLVLKFEACTWPYEHWTHRAHLAVGLSYLCALPFDEAHARIRQQNQKYNQLCGDPNGYHETITVLFLRKIAAALARKHSLPLHRLTPELVDQCAMDWIYRYYSRSRIWSPEAQRAWVEPMLSRSILTAERISLLTISARKRSSANCFALDHNLLASVPQVKQLDNHGLESC